jgi:polygalacturonase
VGIREITIRNSPSYNISLRGCEFATIDGVAIQNGFSDGVDPDGSRHVRISNCFIESIDDAIILKASEALGVRGATEYITVDNCILRTASIHFKFGTESCGDFRDIAVANCVFQGGMSMHHGNLGIALYPIYGGALNNVMISNITMRDVGTPLAILRGDRDRCSFGGGPGDCGSSGAPVRGISIDGSSVTMANSGPPGFRAGVARQYNRECTI